MQIVSSDDAIIFASAGHDFAAAAEFIEDLRELSSRLNIPLEKSNVKAEGGRALSFAMKLETGRFVIVTQLLTQMQKPFNKAEVLLECHLKRRTVHRADLDEVAAFIGIAVKDFHYVAPNKAVLYWK